MPSEELTSLERASYPKSASRPEKAEMLPRRDKNQPPSAEFYQGSLPHPDHLERFEDLAPGAANRFMVMVEAEADHRREMEREQLELNYQLQKQQLEMEFQLRHQALKTEESQTRLEVNVQSRIAMAAHGVAGLLLIAGFVLFYTGHEGGQWAFTAVGAIYTSGTIAGIFRRESSVHSSSGIKKTADHTSTDSKTETPITH